MNELARLIATWFYCGYAPAAPGTAGSLAAALIAFVLVATLNFNNLEIAGLAVLLLGPGIWAAGVVERQLASKDPGIVVVDEVVGQWIAFAGIVHHITWITALAAFGLFRLFDVWKPWPVRKMEKLPGGTGIVLDDVLAGVYAALVMWAAGWFNLY